MPARPSPTRRLHIGTAAAAYLPAQGSAQVLGFGHTVTGPTDWRRSR